MKFIGEKEERYSFPGHSHDFIGKEIDFKAVVYRIKILSHHCFIHVFTNKGIVQCVAGKMQSYPSAGDSVLISGTLKSAQIKDKSIFPNDVEVEVKEIKVLSASSELLPFDISKKVLNIKNDILFDYRMLSMRHPMVKAIFKIQEGLIHGLRQFFIERECTEIRTPKIVKEGAEGGANIFEIDYFGERAYLTQSPQFYKEFCTGVFQRVFEVAPVFRAEKHNTNRHINEYTSIDVELGHIESFYEIMEFEVGALKRTFKYLNENYQYEIELLEIELPQITEVPSLKFREVKKILSEDLGVVSESGTDLSPEEEKKICEYTKKIHQSDFLFVTHYPSSKRPFYTMDDKENPQETLSFDLLFKGVEITTGGQRIHLYEELVEKMKSREMNPNEYEFFSMAHKYGLLPHGGFGMGLERLTQKVIGLESVKLSTMFPRDVTRLTP